MVVNRNMSSLRPFSFCLILFKIKLVNWGSIDFDF